LGEKKKLTDIGSLAGFSQDDWNYFLDGILDIGWLREVNYPINQLRIQK